MPPPGVVNKFPEEHEPFNDIQQWKLDSWVFSWFQP